MKFKPTICPHCGRESPLVDDACSEAWPNDGDVSICWGCGVLAIFDSTKRGGLRHLTLAEAQEVADDNDIQLMIEARKGALQ